MCGWCYFLFHTEKTTHKKFATVKEIKTEVGFLNLRPYNYT